MAKDVKRKWQVIYILGILVAVCSLAAAIILEFGSFMDKNKMEEVRESAGIYVPEGETIPFAEGPVATEVIDPATGNTVIQFVDANLTCPVDFFALWDMCPDIYGYLEIPGTVMSYPVVQKADDPDYYLRRDLNGDYSTPGVLYSQYNHNHSFDTDKMTVIYGHNMRNNTMFGTLDYYDSDESFRDSHPFIYFYTAYNSYRYRVVGVINRNNSNIQVTYNAAYQEGFNDFCNDFNNGDFGEGWIEENFVMSEDDQVLCLSTCNGFYTNRMIVVAVLEERS